MSGYLTPLNPSYGRELAPAEAAPESWAAPAAPTSSGAGQQLARYLSALKRHKWLMLLIVVTGTAIGLVATRFIEPEYEVYSTIYISADPVAQDQRNSGPIQTPNLFRSAGWSELMRTYRIADAVVTKLGLYLTPASEADSAVFANFGINAAQLQPGDYELRIDKAGQRYELVGSEDQVVERGNVGESIGKRLGFAWQPTPAMLGRNRTIGFSVTTPREASVDLARRLQATIPQNTNFLLLSLSGSHSHRAAAALNAWTEEFVNVAADLKRRNASEFANTLEGQLAYAEQELRDAENALERFRVNAITQPTENLSMTPGLVETTPSAIQEYQGKRLEQDNVSRDRQSLERYIAAIRQGSMPPDAIMSIPSVATSNGAQGLRLAIDEYWKLQSEIRGQKQFYTDSAQSVKDLQLRAQTLQTQTIPQAASAVLQQLKLRENDLNSQITSSGQQLRAIPVRTVEEARLRRQVEQSANLYATLKARAEEAKLAEQSTMPDVRVLDPAVAPLRPTKNTAPRIVLVAVAASIGLAILVALLLDQVDRRFRYPDQVSRELGLDIIGAVPTLRRTRSGELAPDEASQVVEAFRSIRLNLRHAFPGRGPVMFTVSSPGAGDGKSLVSSNLAMSFAEAGYRTLLVDGDIRRGALHTALEVEQRPGLLDFLAGEAPLEDVLKPSAYENLTVVPCGTRRRRGPELLTSRGMVELLEFARTSYDAVIVDSAPLGAGIDAYALGAATGNMLLVFRTGATDRKLAQAKLTVLDRLPVRLLGAVLNGIEATGAYQYYSYLYGYDVTEAEEPLRLTSQVGQVTGRS